ncbi:hypothetical protein ACROYT_G023436 [Oculina patagonica]
MFWSNVRATFIIGRLQQLLSNVLRDFGIFLGNLEKLVESPILDRSITLQDLFCKYASGEYDDVMTIYDDINSNNTVCGEPLGVGRHPDRVVIPDNQMKASSEVPGYPASSGRLRDLGWAPDSLDKDPYPYLQINLVNLYLVCGFKIQGCSDFKGKPAWVTRYRVQVSPEENYWDSWNYIKPEFYGGENAKEIVYSSAEERKVGYFVRIFPMTFENAACMKVKVFGEPYITGKVPVFGLEADAVMLYVKREVEKAEDTTVTAKVDGVTIDYSFHPDYAKVS